MHTLYIQTIHIYTKCPIRPYKSFNRRVERTSSEESPSDGRVGGAGVRDADHQRINTKTYNQPETLDP